MAQLNQPYYLGINPKQLYFLGIDPDLHHTGIAIVATPAVWHPPKLVMADVATVNTKLTELDAVMEMAARITHKGSSNDFRNLCDCTSFAVEAQEIYRGAGDANTKNPRSIMLLATVAGAAYCVCRDDTNVKGYMPLPQAWKGNVPKHIHQARVLGRVGLAFEKKGGKDLYCVPIIPDASAIHGSESIRSSDWKHVTDAVGLALYAMDTYFEETARAARLKQDPILRLTSASLSYSAAPRPPGRI